MLMIYKVFDNFKSGKMNSNGAQIKITYDDNYYLGYFYKRTAYLINKKFGYYRNIFLLFETVTII